MKPFSIKDKLRAIQMYRSGRTFKDVAEEFGTSIPLVHYWNKNRHSLMKKLHWKSSNLTKKDSMDCIILTEFDHQSPSQIKNDNMKYHNLDHGTKCEGNQSTMIVESDEKYTQNGMIFKRENDNLNVNNFLFQTNVPNKLSNSRQPIQISQANTFISGLSKIKQLQLIEYQSLKATCDSQMQVGVILKQKEIESKKRFEYEDDIILYKEIEEYNKIVTSDYFTQLVERLHYLETNIFFH